MEKNSIILDDISKIYNASRITRKRIIEERSVFGKLSAREIAALRNISLTIEKGETVGVIGNNGAGKSTLLKVISDVVKPTSGTAEIYGKVVAALEVGVGFHPDLSGIECIIFSCRLLGLPGNEIRRITPAIVEFSELNKVIKRPIKYYSHGMRVRLAFAIIVNVEADILLFDEMQMVGEDAVFRDRAYEKFRQLKQSGKTMMMVSHHLNEIEKFCTQTIVLDKGELLMYGRTNEVTAFYREKILGGK
ncbi:MAG: ABC transporter ATP-binding protein [Bacteroidota bacterium]